MFKEAEQDAMPGEEEIIFLTQFCSKDLLKKLHYVLDNPFLHIDYTAAVEIFNIRRYAFLACGDGFL